jgi:DNA-binding transcriptional LysR family regulator
VGTLPLQCLALEGVERRAPDRARNAVRPVAKVGPASRPMEAGRKAALTRYLVVMDDRNACLAAGLVGMGVICLPCYMAEAGLASGELVPLFEDWHFEAMPMYVVFPANRHVSPKLRAFIEWVVALMAEHAPIRAPRPV